MSCFGPSVGNQICSYSLGWRYLGLQTWSLRMSLFKQQQILHGPFSTHVWQRYVPHSGSRTISRAPIIQTSIEPEIWCHQCSSTSQSLNVSTLSTTMATVGDPLLSLHVSDIQETRLVHDDFFRSRYNVSLLTAHSSFLSLRHKSQASSNCKHYEHQLH